MIDIHDSYDDVFREGEVVIELPDGFEYDVDQTTDAVVVQMWDADDPLGRFAIEIEYEATGEMVRDADTLRFDTQLGVDEVCELADAVLGEGAYSITENDRPYYFDFKIEYTGE